LIHKNLLQLLIKFNIKMSKEKSKHGFKGATGATPLQPLQNKGICVAPLLFLRGCYKVATGCYKNRVLQLSVWLIALCAV
jgi:hypothetical protein